MTLTVKQYCEAHLPIAYFNIFMGETIYIHDIEHDINDSVYVSDVYGNTRRYHKLRIIYTEFGAYFVLHNTRIYFDQCQKIDESIKLPSARN